MMVHTYHAREVLIPRNIDHNYHGNIPNDFSPSIFFPRQGPNIINRVWFIITF